MAAEFLPGLMLRAPMFSHLDYDLLRLPEVMGDMCFQEAVRLASPDFYDGLAAKGFEWERFSEQEKFTLRKYYNRACFRPVPFGGFASFGMTGWSEEELVLDAGKLYQLADGFQLPVYKRPLPRDLSLMVNPTIYKAGRYYRYISTQPAQKGTYGFKLDTIDSVQFNRDLLRFVVKGDCSVDRLRDWIVKQMDCGQDEAADYVFFLLDDQVLLSPLQGKIIGDVAGSASRQVYAGWERNTVQGGVGVQIKSELTKALGALRKLAITTQNPVMDKFIADFSRRFDRQRVPLLWALDPDAGIPYGEQESPGGRLIAGLPANAVREAEKTIAWQSVHRLLLSVWQRDGQDINLTDEDLAKLPDPVLPLPPTLPVLFKETAEGTVIDYAAGVSALQLAGRFSLFSDGVWDWCRDLAETEQELNPDVVFADIGLWSDRHVDNINKRRRIYAPEIPVNVISDADMVLPPTDLLISVRGGELILESAGLKKRVIPRLTTAFNHRHCLLSLYRLLCDMQYQGVQANLAFDLAAFFPGMPYYPRVTYAGTILSPAKWVINDGILPGDLPQRICLGAGDQQLVFDLGKRVELDFFNTCIKAQQNIILQEYLPAKNAQVMQYVAAFCPQQNNYKGYDFERLTPKRRSFGLGSDWLYLKLYCSPVTADDVIAGVIAPLMQRFEKHVTGWFFIRYIDEGYHIRWRIKSSHNVGNLLVAIQKQLKATGLLDLVRTIQGDVYHRELERYGAARIELVEKVFEEGSRLVAGLYAVQNAQPGEPALLWQAIEYLLLVAEVFVGKEQLPAFFDGMAERYMAEFGGKKDMKVALDQKFRTLRTEVARIIANPKIAINLWSTLHQLERMMRDSPDGVREDMAASLIHMQINRLFNAEQRKQEMVVYYLAAKGLRSVSHQTASVREVFP